GWGFATDGGPGLAGDGCDAGIGCQVCCGFEFLSHDFGEDACGGPDPDAWHGGQDFGKRVGIDHCHDFSFDICSLLGQLLKLSSQPPDDMVSSVGPGHDGGLFGYSRGSSARWAVRPAGCEGSA